MTLIASSSFFSFLEAQTPPPPTTVPAATQQKATVVDFALSLTPTQKGIEYDIPSPDEAKRCTSVSYKVDNVSGYMVLGPQKNKLRLLLDVLGSGKLNQWSYFHNNVEVYRDIDSDGNGKVDQSRWFGTAGLRWGIDKNEDGVIDSWKRISAEEVSQEIVLALSRKDLARFLRVALNAEELQNLGLGEAKQAELSKKIGELAAGFNKTATELALGTSTVWLQFDAGLPSLIPADTDGSKNDLVVYEDANVMTVDDKNRENRSIISIGSLIEIAPNNWRVISVPRLFDENIGQYTFLVPPDNIAKTNHSAMSDEIVQLDQDIQKIQTEILSAPGDQRPAMHNEVINRMLTMIAKTTTNEDRDIRIRQLADTIMQAVVKNEFPNGAERIRVLYETIKSEAGNDELSAYVRSRLVMTNYVAEMNSGDDDVKIHLKWIDELEAFVSEYPKTDAGLEGMMQLAGMRESSSRNLDEQIKWYKAVIENGADKPIVEKAKGAVQRLSTIGKPLPFKATEITGNAFDIAAMKGTVTVLYFWDGSSRMAETAAIKVVIDSFAQNGVKIIGVNLETDVQAMKAALAKNPTAATWPQLFAPGGFDGPLATYWGVQIVPLMVIYNKEGNVVNSTSMTAEELQTVLTEICR